MLSTILNTIEHKRVGATNQNMQSEAIYVAKQTISNFTMSVLDKCLDEINQDPENIGAYLASMLLGEMSGQQS